MVWKPKAKGGRLYSNSPLKRWKPEEKGGVSALLSRDGLRRYGVSSVLERLIVKAKSVSCGQKKLKSKINQSVRFGTRGDSAHG